jgi:hypothetical protein
MSKLGLSVMPSDYETATSWVSRLAARNGASYVQDFTEDIGISWRAIVSGDSKAIAELCHLADVPTREIQRCARRTLLNREVSIGTTPVGTKFCQNNILSLCPRCVIESLQPDGQLIAGVMVWWQAVPIRSCDRHRIMLIDLPPPSSICSNYDFAGRVKDNLATIRKAAKRPTYAPIRQFELYMIARLSTARHRTAGWLDAMPVPVVANLCHALGLSLSHRASIAAAGLKPAQLSHAAEKGFKALRHGPSGLFAALRRSQDGPSGGGQGFMHDFKPFHRYLSRMEANEGTQRLKEAVRQYVIENYPTAPGELVLAVPAERRALHSPLSASQVAGASRTRLVTALRAIRRSGALPHLPRPTRQLWVPCEQWDPWLKRYGETITFKEAAPRVGASPAMLQQIIDAGLLTPFADFEKQVPRFHPENLGAFLSHMQRDCQPVATLDSSMVTIDRAPTAFFVPLIDLLRMVWERRLRRLYLRPGLCGLHALVFDRKEVPECLETPKHNGWSCEEARRILGVASCTITFLHRNHLIKTLRTSHHRTRRTCNMITPVAMAEFLAEYETLGRLAKDENRQAKSVLAKLERLGIEPLPLPAPHSKIFRREELQPYFV